MQIYKPFDVWKYWNICEEKHCHVLFFVAKHYSEFRLNRNVPVWGPGSTQEITLVNLVHRSLSGTFLLKHPVDKWNSLKICEGKFTDHYIKMVNLCYMNYEMYIYGKTSFVKSS
jgi:hypothetical protein